MHVYILLGRGSIDSFHDIRKGDHHKQLTTGTLGHVLQSSTDFLVGMKRPDNVRTQLMTNPE